MEKKYVFKFGVLVGISLCIGVEVLKEKIANSLNDLPDAGDILIDTKTRDFKRVAKAIDTLRKLYQRYHEITMGDVYEALNTPSMYTDDQHGWNSGEELIANYYRSPKTQNYILVFPPMDF